VDGKPNDKHDWVPGMLAIIVTVLVALATLTPYVYAIPEKNMNLITQAQTTLWNGWMVILAYYYGTSANQRKSADTINMQAHTANKAGEALASLTTAALPGADVKLNPGEAVKVSAKEDDAS
jgi:hypothetical protein